MTELYGTEDYDELSKDVKYDMEKFKDPYVIGAMIHRLVEERKLTNTMLRDIHKKMNKLVALMEEKGIDTNEALLAEQDEKILEFVRKKGKACAEDVQAKFKYKGKNAASARMNALEKQGFLKKARAGRKVYFRTR
jgi:DNA polymerase I-like protein with 3'-5' exonuclease and polymerase domains